MSNEELARQLNRHRPPTPDRVDLWIDHIALAGRPVDGHLALRARVSATGPGRNETWELTIPLDPTELDAEVNPSAFVQVIRANIDEWWALKDIEQPFADWGRRLD